MATQGFKGDENKYDDVFLIPSQAPKLKAVVAVLSHQSRIALTNKGILRENLLHILVAIRRYFKHP